MDESTARPDQAATEQSSVEAGEDRTNLTDQDPSADGGEPEPTQSVADDTEPESQSFRSPSRLDETGDVDVDDDVDDVDDVDMDSNAEPAPPPRLVRQSAINPSRHVKFTGLDDDDESDDFGPTLAAWLADYQARQNGVDPRGNGEAGEYPTADNPENMGDPGDSIPGSSSNRYDGAMPGPDGKWTGKAQVAITDMLASMPVGSPPGRITACYGDEPVRARGSRFAAMTTIATLAVGVGVLAVVAAARTSGVDVRLDGLVAERGGIVIGRAEASASGHSLPAVSAAGLASLAMPPAVPTPAAVPAAEVAPEPTIEVQPTRIIAPSMGVFKADAGISIAAVTNTTAPDRVTIANSRATMPTPIAGHSNKTEPVERSLASKPSPQPETPTAAVEKRDAPATKAAATTQSEKSLVRIASLDASSITLAAPNATSEILPAVDLDLLINRAGKFLGSGDVIAARLLFERAAQAGDARGARGVGATYDPIRFAEIGVHGIDANPGIALAWYASALDAGDKGAADDISQLNSWMNR